MLTWEEQMAAKAAVRLAAQREAEWEAYARAHDPVQGPPPPLEHLGLCTECFVMYRHPWSDADQPWIAGHVDHAVVGRVSDPDFCYHACHGFQPECWLPIALAAAG